MIDQEWDLNKFVMFMRGKKIEWQSLYWKLIACTVDFKCRECGERFAGNKLNQCTYHHNGAYHGLDQNEVYFPCCNKSEMKFNVKGHLTGC